MNPKVFAVPFILLTTICVLYTGCGIKDRKVIFKRPTVTAFTGSGTYPAPVGSSSAVATQDLSINVYVNVMEIQVAGPQLPGNTAYALSIKEPAMIPVEKITDIKIRPLYAYNDKFKANADISEICEFSHGYTSGDSVSKEVIIEAINHIGRYVDDRDLYIFLKEPPSHEHKQQFIVELITDNKARLADTTVEFVLKP